MATIIPKRKFSAAQVEKLKASLKKLITDYGYDKEDGSNFIVDAIEENGGWEWTIFDAERCKTNIAENCNALFSLVFDGNGLYDMFSYEGSYSSSFLKKLQSWADENGLYFEPYHSWNLGFYQRMGY